MKLKENEVKETIKNLAETIASGKWPEDAMPAIRTFAQKEAKCHDVGEKVAAILTKNEYCKKVLKQKTYKSRKQEEKARKRK